MRRELDDEQELHLGRARAVQAVLVDLPVEQHVHLVEARRDLGLAVSVAERDTEQRDRRHQRIDGIVGERRAQLQRLDLRAQRARDDLGVLGIGALDEDVEVPEPVEDAARGQRQCPRCADRTRRRGRSSRSPARGRKPRSSSVRASRKCRSQAKDCRSSSQSSCTMSMAKGDAPLVSTSLLASR